MRVLVACEFSGTVRDAFRRHGHDAWSCDVPDKIAEGEFYKYHFYEDCRDVFILHWDLIIAHPPCTYLTNSGAKHLYIDMRAENGINEERVYQMQQGGDLFIACWEADAKAVCVENPVMHGMAMDYIRERTTHDPFAKTTRQFVHPYWFGYRETKATGLSRRNLPALKATNWVKDETMALPYAERAKVHYASPGPHRSDNRSRTNPGMAEAMAEQWGSL